ncbi:MAG: type II toxin-antitoxin system RatA family toxin [Gammaproteobacteria bacterium]
MRDIKRSALVPHPPDRMFALINDIERYPEFVPWCTRARVEARSEREIVATLAVRRGPLRAEFTTRNELEPDRMIRLHLVRGPFSVLEGQWILTRIGTTGCRIELRMRFAFATTFSGALFEPVFEKTAASLLDAFVARAKAIYG